MLKMSNNSGVPGYVIVTTDIPQEFWKVYRSAWALPTKGNRSDAEYLQHLYDYRSICDGNLAQCKPSGGVNKNKCHSTVHAWIACEYLDPFLLPQSNEWGEVAP